MILNIDTTPTKSYCVNVLKAPVDVIAVYEDGTTETIATLNEVRQYTFIAMSGETRFIGGEIGKQVLPVPFNSAPALNGDGGGELTPEQERALESVIDGSRIESVGPAEGFTMANNAVFRAESHDGSIPLAPADSTTVVETKLILQDTNVPATPLLTVPDGVTLHWAGDAEPTWEAGKDCVIQLLQTAPTRIEARLFNAPQGAKLPEVSDANWEAMAKKESFATAWPEYTEADCLIINSDSAAPDALLAAKIIVVANVKTLAYINAPNASVYFFGNTATSSSVWNNSKLFCKNFTFCDPACATALNGCFIVPTGHISGVYRVVLPRLKAYDYGYIGVCGTDKVLTDIRAALPNVERNLYIGSSVTTRYKAQPLIAESVIYCLSHLKDLSLLPPDAEGNPVSYGVKIGIDKTLGAIDPADGLWKPTHPGVLAAADEAERKNWAVAFSYAEP